MVYGSNEEELNSVREGKTSRLLVVNKVNLGDLLPEAEPEQFCVSPPSDPRRCFRAGDERVNENTGKNRCTVLIAFSFHLLPLSLIALSRKNLTPKQNSYKFKDQIVPCGFTGTLEGKHFMLWPWSSPTKAKKI